ncbi:hypothetical protein GCM10010112_14720 [Actinoplanes lobatus]|uniref:Uncharacterized protein n=1 Tax=Actinoplanes lobatus TaxID=113568 RepID=A0ABQ4AA17_9ACTN|nr:hypothetical protein GCM10010112_14720 [Actinoplanes lobatus]GIE37838.1 hypothetical protein Alo02nite_07360 [Actinoplanes lobatus]
MVLSTRWRMPGLTPYALRSTFDTAARETPAASATSLIVTDRPFLIDMSLTVNRSPTPVAAASPTFETFRIHPCVADVDRSTVTAVTT